MRVAVTNAKGQLTELIRRAEAGEEVVLTRHGRAMARLVPVEAAVAPAARRKLLGDAPDAADVAAVEIGARPNSVSFIVLTRFPPVRTADFLVWEVANLSRLSERASSSLRVQKRADCSQDHRHDLYRFCTAHRE
jgi:prevent-host-death family protein